MICTISLFSYNMKSSKCQPVCQIRVCNLPLNVRIDHVNNVNNAGFKIEKKEMLYEENVSSTFVKAYLFTVG